ncbi:MAG: four helix bundle protein [Planctomycetaceae bacterium]|nr:four helix bundle protein [Planctomycetaceae bacterium]
MSEANSLKRKPKVVRHTDLEVYQRAFKAAMDVFRLSKSFPVEERYSLTDQIRRSSRSVAANITEAWRKRRYQGSFVSKLNDAEGEAAETQTWLQFAVECRYVEAESTRVLYTEFDAIVAMLVNMQNHSDDWIITKEKRQ